MTRSQWALSIGGIVLWCLLFFFPRTVVEDDAGVGDRIWEEQRERESAFIRSHVQGYSEEERVRLRDWGEASVRRGACAGVVFLDSIASFYLVHNELDSCEKYSQMMVDRCADVEVQARVGALLYGAYRLTGEGAEQLRLAEAARSHLEKVVEVYPKRYDVRVQASLTYLVGARPMRAIEGLRQILEEAPYHEGALLALGVLSFQTQQYAQAEKRLRKLLKMNPGHVEGMLYLGRNCLEMGKEEEAKALLMEVKEVARDSAMVSLAEQYLRSLWSLKK